MKQPPQGQKSKRGALADWDNMVEHREAGYLRYAQAKLEIEVAPGRAAKKLKPRQQAIGELSHALGMTPRLLPRLGMRLREVLSRSNRGGLGGQEDWPHFQLTALTALGGSCGATFHAAGAGIAGACASVEREEEALQEAVLVLSDNIALPSTSCESQL